MENSSPPPFEPLTTPRGGLVFFASLLAGTALAIPEAVDDQYNAAEDVVLNTLAGPVISADFDDDQGTVVPVFEGDWDYLDRMENQLGADDVYPVDGAGRAWNSEGFEVASSTVGQIGRAHV